MPYSLLYCPKTPSHVRIKATLHFTAINYTVLFLLLHYELSEGQNLPILFPPCSTMQGPRQTFNVSFHWDELNYYWYRRYVLSLLKQLKRERGRIKKCFAFFFVSNPSYQSSMALVALASTWSPCGLDFLQHGAHCSGTIHKGEAGEA